MRFVIDMARDAEGRVSGEVTSSEGSASFSGWLELLRLLEGRADHIDERAPGGPESED